MRKGEYIISLPGAFVLIILNILIGFALNIQQSQVERNHPLTIGNLSQDSIIPSTTPKNRGDPTQVITCEKKYPAWNDPVRGFVYKELAILK